MLFKKNLVAKSALLLLGYLFLLGSFPTGVSAQQHKENLPNFVFIAVDDLNWYNSVLGDEPGNFLAKFYPDKRIRQEVIKRLTPNLQRLKKQAITFANAYSAAPLCGPSRTALLTGVPPHHSGYYQHDKHFRHYESLTDAITMPQYLKENGYFTAGLGKVFHKPKAYLDRGFFSDWPDRLYSWSDWVEVNAGIGPAQDIQKKVEEKLSRYWVNETGDKNHFTRFGTTNIAREEANDFVNAHYLGELLTNGEATITGINGSHTLKLPDDKPYFLACGLFAPHRPWVVPQQYLDIFPVEEMQIDENLRVEVLKDLEDLSATGKRITTKTDVDKFLEQGRRIDGEQGGVNAWKAVLQAYLGTIAYSDANIGVLIDAVQKSPKKNNTVLFLWSDHGYHIGDKNREGKVTLWEAANRCNLMIRDFRTKTKDVKITTPVSLQDLYPTIVSMAGLQRPKDVYGNNISSIIENPKTELKTQVLNTHGENNHALRTVKYRYIRFANGDQELYDMQKDPYEYKNLIKDKNSKATLEQLDSKLDSLLVLKPSQYIQ